MASVLIIHDPEFMDYWADGRLIIDLESYISTVLSNNKTIEFKIVPNYMPGDN